MATFEYGDLVQLTDTKGRKHTFTLTEGGEFQNHKGTLKHADIEGTPEGSNLETSQGMSFLAYKPTLSEFVIGMPRGAQVIYPKDLAAMLMMADIYPSCHVLETGVGSGALSMAMLRAGATVTGVELREDFAGRAKANVERFLPAEATSRYSVQLGNSYEALPDVTVDRVALDLPEPWQVIPHIPQVLSDGGIVVSYSPSTTQVSKVTEAFRKHGLKQVLTTEVLHREWHVEDLSVRPDHRMVAHTGFITVARK